MRSSSRAVEAVALYGCVLLSACAVVHPGAAGDAKHYTAVVDSGFRGEEGKGGLDEKVGAPPHYRTIGAALAALPALSTSQSGRAVIFIRNGRYREKLTISRAGVTLLGESRDGTIVTYDAVADTPSPNGGTLGTRGSYTLRIAAPDFAAVNLTIENAFDYNANFGKSAGDPTKLRNPQGVALMTDSASDRASFINVRIAGHQDTLFPNVGRSYFGGCEIRGNVDFIFGAGRAVFENCEIVSLDRHSAANNGYITAASTPDSSPFGFLFVGSRLEKESPSMAPHSVALGRPWHPSADPRARGSVVFVDCWMDDHIGARGWERMSSVDSTGVRIWYDPEGARFFEAGSVGPGAVPSPTRRLLFDADLEKYTVENVLAGWEPPGAKGVSVAWEVPDSEVDGGTGGQGRTLEDVFVGRFPGLEVIRLASGGITFRIRGVGTILGSSEPLIIVDGVELLNGGGGLQFLNPDDIVRVEVLKDVASTGAYGVKGANGVILITTMRRVHRP